jgi:hypothetical protein
VKILLDTCTFLWIAIDAPRLSPSAKDLFADPDNDLFLSAVSSWEIAIKHSQGRLHLPEPPSNSFPLAESFMVWRPCHWRKKRRSIWVVSPDITTIRSTECSSARRSFTALRF